VNKAHGSISMRGRGAHGANLPLTMLAVPSHGQ
jgi:hypothetical protein